MFNNGDLVKIINPKSLHFGKQGLLRGSKVWFNTKGFFSKAVIEDRENELELIKKHHEEKFILGDKVVAILPPDNCEKFLGKCGRVKNVGDRNVFVSFLDGSCWWCETYSIQRVNSQLEFEF